MTMKQFPPPVGDGTPVVDPPRGAAPDTDLESVFALLGSSSAARGLGQLNQILGTPVEPAASPQRENKT